MSVEAAAVSVLSYIGKDLLITFYKKKRDRLIEELLSEKESYEDIYKKLREEEKKNVEILEELGKKEVLNPQEEKEIKKVLTDLYLSDQKLFNAYIEFKNNKITLEDYEKILKATKSNKNKNKIIDNNTKIKELEKKAEENKKKLNYSFYKYDDHGMQITIPFEEAIAQGFPEEMLNKQFPGFAAQYEEIQKLYREYINDLSEIEKLKKENYNLLKNPILNSEKKEELQALSQAIIEQKNNKTEKMSNNKKTNQLVIEPVIDLTAEEKYKQEELKINAEYNREVLDETEAFNEKMKELLKSRNINEIQEAKKNHEEKLKTFEEKNKIELLKHQKNKPGATRIDIENIDSKLEIIKTNSEKEENDKKYNDIQIVVQNSINNTGTGLKNLTSMFQMLGEVTGKQSIKDISNVLGTGSSLFEAFKNTSIGAEKLAGFFGDKAIPGFENFNQGMGIGNIISGALGGGTEGNLGSMIGSGIGTAVGGPVGSIVGGAIGSIGGSIFGSKSKKKKKREERKRKAAQERLQRGLISGQYKWQDVVEAYNEDLLKLGTGSYIDLYDKVSANTDYDNILSSLNGAKSGSDGVSMTTLKQLMPQYNEQQIIDWFKSLTGGAVLKGDILSTGEGKYGAIDIGELAKQVTNTNRDLEKTLKTTIKGIINFSADSLAEVVKKGFFGGMEDLGNNIESMLAESLKNAFVNTEISKSLFNGLSDKVSDVVKDMFVKDGNLGINLEIGELENLSLTQYIELIKKYTETSNEKLEELFRELGLNMDNLTGSMNTLNKNMSKNTVQGMATNLWRYNLGQNVTSEFNGVFEVEIPIILGDQLLDKRIIKITSDSIRKARRNKF
ncbi:hypothetical protein [Fusobacterium varium]|uniref:Uncharacterized protein n=1 Tax=Fusobacterium varium ATCC 27725 TaxID=469618 RepID=A0ABM6U2H9_FUSVA|nr:hypothetical protein [Fusobacterium varium]AVQ30490.1 hypothetical protein C4N18_04385 [Fusobacterium varium ATCC 27725]